MNATVLPLLSDVHRATQAVLPWYLTQSLETDEMQAVEAHLIACPQCRAELALEQHLLACCQGDPKPVEHDVEAGLARVHQRMASVSAPASTSVMPVSKTQVWMAQAHSSVSRALRLWTTWVLAAQTVVILALAGELAWLSTAPADLYHTLGSPAAETGANFIVRFREDASVAQMRQALRAAGARLVDGPTASDAYLLSVPPERRSTALRALHADTTVMLAEALDPADARSPP